MEVMANVVCLETREQKAQKVSVEVKEARE